MSTPLISSFAPSPYCSELLLEHHGFIRLFLHTPLEDIARFESVEKARIACLCPLYVLQTSGHNQELNHHCFYQKQDGLWYRSQHYHSYNMKNANWDILASEDAFLAHIREYLGQTQHVWFLDSTLEAYRLYHHIQKSTPYRQHFLRQKI